MLTVLRRRLAKLRHGEDGVTLVELLVAMGLATIVGTMTMLMFSSANTSVNATSDRLIGSAGARTVLQSWQALIQTADMAPVTNSSGQATGGCPTGTTAHRFEWLTPSETLFYSDVSNRSGSTIGCTPPTLVWLGLRSGRLLSVQYKVVTLGTSYQLSACQQLTDPDKAKVTSSSLFTPNPGQPLISVDYGSSFAARSPFATASSCANVPTSVALGTLTDTDASANNALAQMTTVGIDFTVADMTGTHTQTFDSTVPIFGGISS